MLRENLFEALRMAGFKADVIQDFDNLNCYLMPSFSFPCGRDRKRGNTHPNREMVEHSAREHLRKAVDYVDPTNIVLLGERATWAGRAFRRPCYITNWPTTRHKNYRSWWEDYLVPTLKVALGK